MKKENDFTKPKCPTLKPSEKIKVPNVTNPDVNHDLRFDEEYLKVQALSKEEIVSYAQSKDTSGNNEEAIKYYKMALIKAEEIVETSEEDLSFLVSTAILLCNSYIKYGFTWRVKPYVDKAFDNIKSITMSKELISKYFDIAKIYQSDDRYAQEIAVLDYLKNYILYNEKNDEEHLLDIYYEECKAQRLLFGNISEELVSEIEEMLNKEAADNILNRVIEEKYLKFDQVENSNNYLEIKEELEEKIYQKMKNYNLSSMKDYYQIKKEMLLNDYNIIWKSPEELNPDIDFK